MKRLFLILLLLFACTPKKIPTKEIRNEVPTESMPAVLSTELEENCIGFLLGSSGEAEFINEIGGGWARPHPGPFAWDNDIPDMDSWVKNVQKYGIAIMATVWPYNDIDQASCRSDECLVPRTDVFYKDLPRSRCMPCDMDAYLEFLKMIVERYDGDMDSDMPGLRIPIKYWEILNEPDMNSRELTFFIGTPEEYAELLTKSYDAIKSVCEDCMVLQGGAAGNQEEFMEFWEKVFLYDPKFDIANIHHIGSGDLETLNVADFSKLTDKPIWVTEAQFNSEDEIETGFYGALEAGAEKVFFTQFKIGQSGPPKKGVYGEPLLGLKCD